MIVDPAEAAVGHGGEVIYLQLELDIKEEYRAFSEWCDSITKAGASKGLVRGRSLPGLVAAFLLG